MNRHNLRPHRDLETRYPLLVATTHSPLATTGHVVMAAGGDLIEHASGHVDLAKFVGTQLAGRDVRLAKIDSAPTDGRSYIVGRVRASP